MSSLDVHCYACNETFSVEAHPPAYNSDNERVCPRCNSDFIELLGRQTENASTQASWPPAAATFRRVIRLNNGTQVELHVAAAEIPTGGGPGAPFPTHGFPIGPPPWQPLPWHSLGDGFMQGSFDQLLNRLGQMYQPPTIPTAQETVDTLPRVKVPQTPMSEEELARNTGPDGNPLYGHCRAGEACTVCHDDFQAEGTVLELPCHHCFHEDCILPWLKEHNTCPVCRHKLPEGQRPPPAEDSQDMFMVPPGAFRGSS